MGQRRLLVMDGQSEEIIMATRVSWPALLARIVFVVAPVCIIGRLSTAYLDSTARSWIPVAFVLLPRF
jgi:hypothetical protein